MNPESEMSKFVKPISIQIPKITVISKCDIIGMINWLGANSDVDKILIKTLRKLCEQVALSKLHILYKKWCILFHISY